MARKTSKKKEDFEIAAVDIDASIRTNIVNGNKSDIPLSVLAFGTLFSNWKNYIDVNSLENTKKEFYPAIGQVITNYDGDSFKIVDITLEYEEYHPKINDANPDTVYRHPVYIINLEKL